jgi:hypothetical protein
MLIKEMTASKILVFMNINHVMSQFQKKIVQIIQLMKQKLLFESYSFETHKLICKAKQSLYLCKVDSIDNF